MFLLAIALLASPAQLVLDNMANSWWLIGGTADDAVFVDPTSLVRRPDYVLVAYIRVLDRKVGIKAQSGSLMVSCANRTSSTIRLSGLDENFNKIIDIPIDNDKFAPIKPDTIGDMVARYACNTSPDLFDRGGYPSLIPLPVAADHLMRLIGIGLNADAAGAFAAMDAEKAPIAFNQMLNAVIEKEYHLMVRAIKTPSAQLWK